VHFLPGYSSVRVAIYLVVLLLFRGEFGRREDPERYFHLEPMDKKNSSVRIFNSVMQLSIVCPTTPPYG
jgi:hypothetical protein